MEADPSFSMAYLWVFFASLAVDLVPIIGPPAWTVMVLLLLKFDLNPWLVLAAGVPGSVFGRYALTLYAPFVAHRIIKQRKNHEFEFVGRRLRRKLWQNWLFVFAYSVSPLPTTPLFSAAGLAKIPSIQIIPPFLVGKFISDAVMLFAGREAFADLADLFQGTFSPRGAITAGVSVLIIAAFLFIDWRQLLERKQVRFNVHIWK